VTQFLNFSQISQYSPKGFIKSITSLSPDGTFNSGDTINVVLAGVGYKMVVLENTPITFCWRGSLYGLFIGDHRFSFTGSKPSPGQTTFIQEENFSGVLGWIMGEGVWARALGMRESTRKNFEGFNEDLKAWSEKE